MRFLPRRISRVLVGLGCLAGVVMGSIRGAEDDAATARKEGRRDIKSAIASGDSDKLDLAVAQLAKAGGAASMKLVLDYLEKMPASEDSLYWSLIGGAVSFRDRPAMEELGKLVVAKKAQPIARDILYGLAKNSSPYIVLPLRSLLVDAGPEMRVLVAKKVSRIRSPDAVDALIELLKVEEKTKSDIPSPLALIAVDGLTKITRQSFGPNSINWEGWWKKNREVPLPTGEEDSSQARTGTAVDFIKLSPDRERQEAFIGVEQAPVKAVVVLNGEFTKKVKKDVNNDKMQTVLERMKIPYTIVNRDEFSTFDLKETGVLLINCILFHEMCICPTCKPSGVKNDQRLKSCTGCNKHINWSGQMSGGEVQKIKSFVMSGGYIFCEDWIAEEVAEKAFPEYVAAEEKRALKEAVVDVMPARGMGTHPYLKGIFEPKFINPPPAALAAHASEPDPADSGEDPDEPKQGTTVVVNSPPPEEGEVGAEAAGPVKVKHKWKIDDKSYPLKVVDKSRVVTLLTSGQLQKEAGVEGTVALAFRPGSSGILPGTKSPPRGTPGVVTLVLSHFGHQDSTEDEMSIQTLLLNVLIDANSAREARVAKKGDKAAAKKASKPEAPAK